MSYKSRENFALSKNISQERWDNIFRKKSKYCYVCKGKGSIADANPLTGEENNSHHCNGTGKIK